MNSLFINILKNVNTDFLLVPYLAGRSSSQARRPRTLDGWNGRMPPWHTDVSKVEVVEGSNPSRSTII